MRLLRSRRFLRRPKMIVSLFLLATWHSTRWLAAKVAERLKLKTLLRGLEVGCIQQSYSAFECLPGRAAHPSSKNAIRKHNLKAQFESTMRKFNAKVHFANVFVGSRQNVSRARVRSQKISSMWRTTFPQPKRAGMWRSSIGMSTTKFDVCAV